MAKRQQSVRIIAGKWRGRLLPVLDQPGLKPTKDMVRETLFNWLQSEIAGKRCLDCFAGTGALGFEAASRAAAEVVLLETAKYTYQHLLSILKKFEAEKQVQVLQQSAFDYLLTADAFDIIFLDPPFQENLWQQTLKIIDEKQLLKPLGTIYIEMPRQQVLPPLPDNWHIEKEKLSGQVRFALIKQMQCIAK